MMAIKMMTMMMMKMMMKMSWPYLMANAARKIGNVDPKVVSLRLKMVVSLSGSKRPRGGWKSRSMWSKMGGMGIVGPSSQPEQRPLTIVAIHHPLNQPFWHCCNTSMNCNTSFKLKSDLLLEYWNQILTSFKIYFSALKWCGLCSMFMWIFSHEVVPMIHIDFKFGYAVQNLTLQLYMILLNTGRLG